MPPQSGGAAGRAGKADPGGSQIPGRPRIALYGDLWLGVYSHSRTGAEHGGGSPESGAAVEGRR